MDRLGNKCLTFAMFSSMVTILFKLSYSSLRNITLFFKVNSKETCSQVIINKKTNFRKGVLLMSSY